MSSEFIAVTTLPDMPVMTWIVELPTDEYRQRPPFHLVDLCQAGLSGFEDEMVVYLYRGVHFGRLETVLRTGIDVEPADSVIFADFFDKAWEYGEYPKCILGFKRASLERSFRCVPRDTPEDELRVFAATYPTRVVDPKDPDWIWLSRLRPDDTRLATPYEEQFAYWIPDDPRDVLQTLFIITRPSDHAETLETLAQYMVDPTITASWNRETRRHVVADSSAEGT